MPHSLELKAAVADRLALDTILTRVGATGPEILVQHDLHLRSSKGRLALRRTEGAPAVMLAWRRDPSGVPAASSWESVAVDDADTLALELMTHGALGSVRRWRTLWRVGDVRVHLDEHDDGTERLELVAPFEPDDEDSRSAAHDAIVALAATLGVRDEDVLSGSIADGLEDASSADARADATSLVMPAASDDAS